MTQHGTTIQRAGHRPDMDREEARRDRLQRSVSAWLDWPLAALALVMLALIIVEFAADLSDAWSARITAIQIGIWLVFIAAFVVELSLAPRKLRFLRRNWITVIALAVPMFRVLRALRAVRVLRSVRLLRGLSLVRVTTALRRAVRALGGFARASQLAYVLVMSLLVAVTGAAAAFYFEREAEGATIASFGDALWWAATIFTTINSPLDTVTVEGRVVALIMRILGVAVAGYLTAALAVFLIGRPASGTELTEGEVAQLRREIEALRREIARLSGGR